MDPSSSCPPQGGREIIVTDRRWRCHVKGVERLVSRTLAVADCTADVVLTNDATVRRLNHRDRGKNKPTNVLTYEQPPEILLAFGVVQREAGAAGKTIGAHLAHLLVHGALHLAGYEHDAVGEAREMEAEETRLLSRIGVKNPWKNK